MEKSIRVQILGRTYSLFVREEDEALTREMAGFVNARMTAFKKAHPEQPELTAAVIAALAIAEELYATREALDEALENLPDTPGGDGLDEELAATLDALADHLEDALTAPLADAPAQAETEAPAPEKAPPAAPAGRDAPVLD